MQPLTSTLPTIGIAQAPHFFRAALARASSIELRCPVCRENLLEASYRSLAQSHATFWCTACRAQLRQEQGIWLALSPVRQAYFARFMKEYEHIRKEEGRGSNDPEFYR